MVKLLLGHNSSRNRRQFDDCSSPHAVENRIHRQTNVAPVRGDGRLRVPGHAASCLRCDGQLPGDAFGLLAIERHAGRLSARCAGVAVHARRLDPGVGEVGRGQFTQFLHHLRVRFARQRLGTHGCLLNRRRACQRGASAIAQFDSQRGGPIGGHHFDAFGFPGCAQVLNDL